PVLQPPAMEFANVEAMQTIGNYSHLFNITMPIKTDVFQDLLTPECLQAHPNQAFVQSVIIALKEGFWPWANTWHETEFLVTWDNSRMSPRSEMEQMFINRYRDEEIAAEHFSKPFGSDLLPGMYSMPVHAVPKPHSEDFCMVSNMSVGLYAPNQMICHEDIAGSCLNSLHTL
ncbi:hypothetical protein IW262DRAFT_1231562, partial [Armillaria fumosa]